MAWPTTLEILKRSAGLQGPIWIIFISMSLPYRHVCAKHGLLDFQTMSQVAGANAWSSLEYVRLYEKLRLHLRSWVAKMTEERVLKLLFNFWANLSGEGVLSGENHVCHCWLRPPLRLVRLCALRDGSNTSRTWQLMKSLLPWITEALRLSWPCHPEISNMP